MEKIKFEDGLKKIEKIVDKLESGDLSLEESLKLYEEGVRLTRFCRESLDAMEKKIEILTKDKDGKLSAQPFELEAGKDET